MINVQIYIFCQFNMLTIILQYNQDTEKKKLCLLGYCYRKQMLYDVSGMLMEFVLGELLLEISFSSI
jgi:hypothetical protein